MNTEISTLDAPLPAAVNPLDMSPGEFRGALTRRGENRTALVAWVRDSMVEGVDFGCIPMKGGRMSKPSLWKPGAEKICGMLNVTATFPTLTEYEKAALEGRSLQEVVIRCHLITASGQVVADGIGARSLEKDYGDLNKALKMALKSAHIDATLRMAGLSEVFTQDLEDMRPEASQAEQGDSAATAGYTEPQRSTSTFRSTNSTRKTASEKQIKLVQWKLDQAGLSATELCKQFNLESLPKLSFERVDEALKWITAQASQTRTREPAKPGATDFDEGEPPYSEEDAARFSR